MILLLSDRTRPLRYHYLLCNCIPNEILCIEIAGWIIIQNIATTVRNEELEVRQKSRMIKMAAGDSNSDYFHKSLLNRRNTNKILTIYDRQGQKLEEEEHIER